MRFSDIQLLHIRLFFGFFVASTVGFATGCESNNVFGMAANTIDEAPGDPSGSDTNSCTATDNGDGSYTLTCPNGSSVTWTEGTPGDDGTSCTVDNNGATKTITCTDGTTATVTDGQDGSNGSSCSATSDGSGSATINCDDGSSAAVSEVISNILPNGAILEGSYDIVNNLDVAFLQPVTMITGTLVVNAPYLTALNLPNLTVVGGTFQIGVSPDSNPKLLTFSMPTLTTVGGNLTVTRNSALTNFSLPVDDLRGNLFISYNTALTSFTVATTIVGGHLDISANPVLPSVSLSVVDIGGELGISNNTLLSHVAMPVVSIGDHLVISSNSQLTNLALTQLVTVSNNFWIINNPALCLTSINALDSQVTQSGTTDKSGNNGAC